jgi:hypothetical protein
MTRLFFVFVLLLATPIVRAQSDADRWWAHIVSLSDDSLQGRATGSDGYRQAAAYVADQFKKAGLEPGGTNGYFQSVSFVKRRIVEEKSSLTLIRGDKEEHVAWGDEAMVSMRIDHASRLEAPLVFVGYGLRIPEASHDDLAGVDLRGKIAVLLTGKAWTCRGNARWKAGSCRRWCSPTPRWPIRWASSWPPRSTPHGPKSGSPPRATPSRRCSTSPTRDNGCRPST